MNPWPIYETAKRHWRKTRTFMNPKEMRWHHPDATQEEILEGMIEFSIAYEKSFRHETFDFDEVELPPRTTPEMVRENNRIRRELFRMLDRIKETDEGA